MLLFPHYISFTLFTLLRPCVHVDRISLPRTRLSFVIPFYTPIHALLALGKHRLHTNMPSSTSRSRHRHCCCSHDHLSTSYRRRDDSRERYCHSRSRSHCRSRRSVDSNGRHSRSRDTSRYHSRRRDSRDRSHGRDHHVRETSHPRGALLRRRKAASEGKRIRLDVLSPHPLGHPPSRPPGRRRSVPSRPLSLLLLVHLPTLLLLSLLLLQLYLLLF